MFRWILSILIPIVLFANGLTTQPLGSPTDVIHDGKVYPYLRTTPQMSISSYGEQKRTISLAQDSIQTVLLPGEMVYIRVDANSDVVEAVDSREPLPEDCNSAIDISPVWLRNDLYQSFRHLPSERAEELAGEILAAPEEQIDEIAFCVAHLSPQALTDTRFDTELLSLNAYWIYRLADSLDYVELVEYGSGDDWHTTTAYWVVSEDLTDTTLMEIPREIYYWFVVHPKLSDEAPKMRDIPSDTRQMTFGYFWREFLWTDPDEEWNYTDDGEYPLLADWMKQAKVMWIRNDTVLSADRPIDSTNSALDIAGEWVSTVMPFEPGYIRPIQPNQIAIAHYGNCGEVQDLLAAAARTALLPVNCVGTMLQDHVWNEFWDYEYPGELWTEDPWHCYQVDRWGGVTSLAPSWGGYDTDRGGSKNVNNALTWRGDGYMLDRTPAYTYVCTLIVEVLDAFDNPVPGAEVLFASNYYNDSSGALYYADIRATDKDGKVIVAMGDSCPYYFRVDSPVGSYPEETGVVSAFPGLGEGLSVVGETYIASVNLSGALSNLPITELTPTTGPRELTLTFHATDEYIRGTGRFDSQEGTYSYRSPEGRMTVFVCDSANFQNYLDGLEFDAYEYHSRQTEGELVLELPTRDVWYAVASAEEMVTNDNLIFMKAELNIAPGVQEVKIPDKLRLTITPNPFNSACRIEIGDGFDTGRLKILDITGKVVKDIPVKSSEEIIWNGEKESGVYLVKLITDNFQSEKKIVLLK
ncbi:hypothetical protein DRQ33_03075 [bacterium]|nr:MAG: hypothetical protein DRQ33_03075 [bacterium]